MFSRTSLKFKLFAGFLTITLFVIITGGIAYWGVTTLGNSMKVIVDDEAPIVDAVMRMKVSVMGTLMTFDEFRGATAVLPIDDESEVAGIKAKFSKMVKTYDKFGDLIVKGGTLEGRQFNATDNKALRTKVLEADKLHNDVLQSAVVKMHEIGERLFLDKKERDEAMVKMEKAFDKVVAVGVATDKAIERRMNQKKKAGQFAQIVRGELLWADHVMEMKSTIGYSRIRLEEIVQQTELDALNEIVGEYNKTITEFDNLVDPVLKGGNSFPKVTDPVLRKMFETLDKIHNNMFQPAAKTLIENQKKLIKRKLEMDAILEVADKAGESQTKLLSEIEELSASEMMSARERGLSAWSQATYLVIAAIVVAVVLSIIISLLVTSSISKPIFRFIDELRTGADEVTSASSQISDSSQSLAEGATEQASSLEETSSSLEEIASTTQQNADNAANAETLMSESKDMVDNGVHEMENMVGAMDSIKESSSEISKIIKVIEEIAFQTNLLALNAAVEAARAGEHGKGFAVVAEEVRNLAQRSATASKDTASLIENAVGKSQEGGAIVERSSKALNAIAESTQKVSHIVSEIAAASKEQSIGIDQVNTAVTQMDEITQRNAASSEETAAASEELNAQAKSLDDVVNGLSGLITGADNDLPAPDQKKLTE